MKNGESRLKPSELGMLVYGRNILQEDLAHPMVKEMLKCARTHLIEKKELRTRESVTAEEIEALETEFAADELRTADGVDWTYTGYDYRGYVDGVYKGILHHPNRELFIKRYLDGLNENISEFNREVQMIVKADFAKYD